jgi:hypothetical protein
MTELDEVSRERAKANPMTGGEGGEKQNLQQMDDFQKIMFFFTQPLRRL